ncbi:multicopper oxidase [Zasmidium cellare ATCC 36951]|uniref:laccase n=1 Tax=Zasmidium cellare ATCC 36951 TaxID=1080233 RepID=A0A6A6CG79_ZASCE|nr:multicopper oxidase [Zasmidium cellare ATCC 36951]KAF2166071.1 multicopper oxidase [Zasmidium cellare ATCC 36951]
MTALLDGIRQAADQGCTNGPNTRACWKSGFSIATDFDKKLPPAGKTVTYNLEITNTTHMAPDGYQRLVMAINGQYPGPTIYADWGDTLVVNVKNSLQHNGTSIHWHGLRQLNSCQHDGVNGVTECPIAPGQTKQYVIRCTQFGTSWYHSHYSAQYGDGIVGGIVINGPATANYDTDLGTMTFTDWFYETAFAMNVRALHSTSGPPRADTGLINGTMKRDDGKGAYHVTTVKKGKKHRLRLINTGIDNLFHVSIDNHNFTVITSDFVPIKPFTASSVSIGIGQRYDIIINANQPVANYWLRADVGTACGRNLMAGKILSIMRYEGAPVADPTSTNTITKPTACYDESVTPYVTNLVPADQFTTAMKSFSMDFNVSRTADGGALIQWLINGSDIRVNWEKPTLQHVLDSNYTFESKHNVFEISQIDTWTFWVIQTVQGDPVNLPHPIHLHGHDFYVLGAGAGVWDGNQSNLKFSNPPRRDTATLPAGGYLIMGFPADNPGLWLMHCHIPWHVGQGLSMQFLERKDEIIGKLGDLGDYQKTCDSWKEWWNRSDRPYHMDDSGL